MPHDGDRLRSQYQHVTWWGPIKVTIPSNNTMADPVRGGTLGAYTPPPRLICAYGVPAIWHHKSQLQTESTIWATLSYYKTRWTIIITLLPRGVRTPTPWNQVYSGVRADKEPIHITRHSTCLVKTPLWANYPLHGGGGGVSERRSGGHSRETTKRDEHHVTARVESEAPYWFYDDTSVNFISVR